MLDLIIRNARIVDGTGAPSFPGDIGVSHGRIEEIGPLQDAIAEREIDARGAVAAPGFIDIHSHADLAVHLDSHADLLEPLVMQGITTFVGGNCGFSGSLAAGPHRDKLLTYLENLSGLKMGNSVGWENPAGFMSAMESRGMLLNMALLAGHGTLRIAASGLVTRLLEDAEQRAMERYLEESLEQGCLGMSTGLQYFPGLESDAAELDGCGKVLARYGGVFTSHLRSYAHTIDLALDEVFAVGRNHGVPIQVSHLYWQPYTKGMGALTRAFARAGSFAYNRLHIPIPIEKTLEAKLKRFDEAEREGVRVHFDLVPTAQGFTELFAFLPPYVSEGGKEQALARLADKAFRVRVKRDIARTEPAWPHRDGATWSFNYIKMTGWSGLRVMAVAGEANRWMEGKTFPEIGAATKRHAFDALCDLLIAERGEVMVFHTPTVPDDPFIFRSMRSGFTHPRSVPATDTILRPSGRPAHIFYDCFPRFLQVFTRETGLLSLEEAVRKCTSLPAACMNIPGRGILKKNFAADIVVFDPDAIATDADFYRPRVHPRGIGHVFINGTQVVSDGKPVKNALPGNIIRRGQAARA
ncbi:MAG: D-aminoacylase [Spirochaetes bacterium]|nr:MAG: D-aminoacylase [Spirochaetota bacterium]